MHLSLFTTFCPPNILVCPPNIFGKSTTVVRIQYKMLYFVIELLGVTGQNGSGQNGTDKMVRTKWYGQNGIGQNGTDKMVWTKWYNFIFCVHFNLVEFNIHLVTKSHE